MGCLAKFTLWDRLSTPLRLGSSLKVTFQTAQNEHFEVLKWRSRSV